MAARRMGGIIRDSSTIDARSRGSEVRSTRKGRIFDKLAQSLQQLRRDRCHDDP